MYQCNILCTFLMFDVVLKRAIDFMTFLCSNLLNSYVFSLSENYLYDSNIQECFVI